MLHCRGVFEDFEIYKTKEKRTINVLGFYNATKLSREKEQFYTICPM